MKNLMNLVIVGLVTISVTAFGGEGEADSEPSLYERLGAAPGIEKIVNDTIALHLENEEIAHYFEGVDIDNLSNHVQAFFAMGTGGPAAYEGRDMTSTHAHMNMSNADFDAAVADVLKAVKANGVDEESTNEVAAILESLRPAVMGTADS